MLDTGWRHGRLPFFLIAPVVISAGLVAFMFYWNGRQADLLADWWRERTARAVWEAMPRLAGLSPRELIEYPDRTAAILPQSGVLAIGFANARGWVVEPFGVEGEFLKSLGPFPRYGATCLPERDMMIARFPLRGSGPPRRLVNEVATVTGSVCPDGQPGGIVESEVRGFGNGRGNGPGFGGGPGRGQGRGPGAGGHGPGGRFEADVDREGSPMPGGGPFEVVFLVSENGTPPVVPLVVQRWLWPLAWVVGTGLWIWLFRHRERLSALERDRQREAHLAVVGQATARLAHEIKNPLGAIRGAAQHVLARPLAPLQQEMIRMIEQETGRLEELTRGVLDFARPISIRPIECDLAAVMRNVRSLSMMRSPTPEIRLEGIPDTLTMRCDSSAVTQILVNLLENARAASGGGTEPIEIVYERLPKAYQISVLDRGEGLSEEARAHLFEPFFSTKPRGYGLGLVISKRLAEAHGGTLRLEPRGGGGCRAEFRIPEEVQA